MAGANWGWFYALGFAELESSASPSTSSSSWVHALPAISQQALVVRALARQHQETIWARQLTVNRLRSVLLEFYPAALQAFPNLTHRAAITIPRMPHWRIKR